MTFSLAARCRRTGMLGAAISSSSIAVGSRCVFARAGLGVVLTQHRTDPRLGPLGLDLLAQGKSPRETINALVVVARPQHGWRQLAAIDRLGNTAHFSGGEIASIHAAAEGEGVVAIGNLLANPGVAQAEADVFARDPQQHLGERLLRALAAGLAAGGEPTPVRSAALLVVHRESFPLVDLRVDDHDEPIAELRRLWSVFEPQMDDFLVRAIAPHRAGPSTRP